MSHDQKPARVRVVKGAGDPLQRRRDDAGTAATALIENGENTEPKGPATRVPPAAAASGGIMLPALFLIAAAAGGIAVAMVGRL